MQQFRDENRRLQESLNPLDGINNGVIATNLNDAATAPTENRNATVNDIHANTGDDSTGNDHAVAQLEIFGKRAMEATAGTDSAKIRRMDNDFNALPIIPGIDTTRPINFVR